MEITIETLINVFRECNTKYFNGKLTEPNFKLVFSRQYCASYYKDTITFSKSFMWTNETIIQLMAHEMIHLYQHQNKIKHVFAHGILFKIHMFKLNKQYNIGIKVHPQLPLKYKGRVK